MVGMNKAKRLSQNTSVGLLYKLYPPTTTIYIAPVWSKTIN